MQKWLTITGDTVQQVSIEPFPYKLKNRQSSPSSIFALHTSSQF